MLLLGKLLLFPILSKTLLIIIKLFVYCLSVYHVLYEYNPLKGQTLCFNKDICIQFSSSYDLFLNKSTCGTLSVCTSL
jgi:hypothetical protein